MESTNILIHNSPGRSGHNFIRFNVCSWLGLDPRSFYLNYEGIPPSRLKARMKSDNRVRGNIFERRGIHYIVPRTIKIISNRDLLDWMASMYKSRENKSASETHINLGSWAEYTREIYGMTNHFPGAVGIIYDLFATSETYRRVICDNVGGEYNEEYLNFVPPPNRGSSFDQMNFQGQGSSMSTTKRYLAYIHNSTYRENLERYPEVVELYKSTFKPSPQKLTFLESLNT